MQKGPVVLEYISEGAVEGFHLVSFADADYASKATDRRSVSGGVVMCAGEPVSWYSKDSEMRQAVNHAGKST